MQRSICARLKWVRLYEKTGNAGLVCRRFGISRPILRKWHQRFLESGIDGLRDQSKKPRNSPNRKIDADIKALILDIRQKRKLGARIQNELKRLHSISLSLASIHKVLSRNKVKPLR